MLSCQCISIIRCSLVLLIWSSGEGEKKEQQQSHQSMPRAVHCKWKRDSQLHLGGPVRNQVTPHTWHTAHWPNCSLSFSLSVFFFLSSLPWAALHLYLPLLSIIRCLLFAWLSPFSLFLFFALPLALSSLPFSDDHNWRLANRIAPGAYKRKLKWTKVL